MGKIVLQVGNLPSNRLALTNKVYLSPKIHSYLVEAAQTQGSSSSSSSTSGGLNFSLLAVAFHLTAGFFFTLCMAH